MQMSTQSSSDEAAAGEAGSQQEQDVADDECETSETVLPKRRSQAKGNPTNSRNPSEPPQGLSSNNGSVLPPTFLNDLQQTANAVFPTPSARYNQVFVLLLVWKYVPFAERDLHEAEKLKAVFENDLRIPKESTEIWRIPPPSSSSMSELKLQLKKVESKHQRDGGLLIVYYVGPENLSSMVQRLMKGVIKGTDERVSEIVSVFQETLQRSPYDVWLILDTYYTDVPNLLDPSKYTVGRTSKPMASTSLSPSRSAFSLSRSFRDGLRSARKFEVLHAGSVASHPRSGNHSFSARLARRMRDLLDETGTFTIEQLYSSLVFYCAELKLFVVPEYLNYSQSESIQLSPFESPPHPRKIRKMTITTWVAHSLQEKDMDDWRLWIRNNPPSNIQKVEVLPSANTSRNGPSNSFLLLVWLQDSLIPESESWLRWMEHLLVSLRDINVETEPSEISDTADVVSTYVAQLNLDGGMKDALQKVFYSKVTVLPLMWGSPNPNRFTQSKGFTPARGQELRDDIEWELDEIRDELSGLGKVFREDFNFHVEDIFEIKDTDKHEDCQELLRTRVQKLLNGHNDPHSLVIIIYGGHGIDTSSPDSEFFGKKNEGNSMWGSNGCATDHARVNWTEVQSMIVQANCDSLMILDCCHAATAARGSQNSTNEILAASVKDMPSWTGMRAYSKLLKRKLQMMQKKGPFTVSQLHEEMMKHSATQTKTDPMALLATPAHGYARRSSYKTIRLDALPRAHGIGSMKSSDKLSNSKNTRVFMEIELDPKEKFDAGSWQRWFRQQHLPPIIQGYKFYTEEGLHIKTITENAARARWLEEKESAE